MSAVFARPVKSYRAWRARRDKQERDDLFKQHTKDGATVGAAFKHGLIATAALVVPLGCAVIAFLAAGYYFNGGQDWNGDTQSLSATVWRVGGVWAPGAPDGFGGSLLAGQTLAFPGRCAFCRAGGVRLHQCPIAVPQYPHRRARGGAHRADALGHSVCRLFPGRRQWGAYILIARSCVTTVLEVACCYVLARATISTKKIITALREKAQAQQELARYQRLEHLDKSP